jgi:5,10-methylenetetrahydromethanopterin reductase
MVRYGTQLSLDPGWGEIQKTGGYASTLEGLGYSCIWCLDERFGRSPYTLLSLAALHTETAQLGVSVTNPYTRHPLITGAAAATLNELSAGRAVLGLGAGASSLFERHGVERPSPPLKAIREAVQMLRPFLRGEKVDYKGAVRGAGSPYMDFESRPVPIYIAARGPRLLRLAGEVADGVIIGSLASEQGLGYALENVTMGLERSGRSRGDIEVVFWAYTSIKDDPEEARSNVKQLVVSSMWSSRGIMDRLGVDAARWRPIEQAMVQGFKHGRPASRVYEDAASMLSPETVDAWSVTGSADTVARRAREITRRGVDQFAVLALGNSMMDRMETQRAFADAAGLVRSKAI